MSALLRPLSGQVSSIGGELAERRVTEKGREAVPDEPSCDDVVAVAVRAERGLRVVYVEDAQPLEPERRVQLVECLVEHLGVGDVDARGPPVTGVQADAEPPMPVERVAESGKLTDGATDRPAGTRGILEAEPEVVGRQLEQVVERRCHLLDRGPEAVPEMRADVEDDRVGGDLPAPSPSSLASASNDFFRTSRSRLARFTR